MTDRATPNPGIAGPSTDAAASPHSRIDLVAERCTSCMICVRECPTWCITLSAHQELISDPTARRPRVGNVLDEFTIDWGLCMFCGICVTACPFDALQWQPDPVPAARRIQGLREQFVVPEPGQMGQPDPGSAG